MANTYKNIVITPNRSSNSDDPKIVFSGANTTSNTDITLRMYPTSNGTLSFEGSAGQLFSITNDLTGTIYSVNDVSGIPSIAVYANGQIDMARYSGNLYFGSSNNSLLKHTGYANIYFGATSGNTMAPALRVSKGASPIGNYSYDTLVVESDDVATIRVGESDGTQGGMTWGDSNTTFSTTHGMRFFTGGSAGGNIYSGMGGTLGLYVVSGSARSPLFYDLDDTGYYVNPNSSSSVYGISIRGDASGADTGNQIFFWGSGATTTSAIGFKSNNSPFSNPTGNGDGYNTYFSMDTDGRGWVFRRATGGTDFSAAYTSGWILNNGIWQANASMRSPIFYDSGNTGYYTDPASTSNLYGLTVNQTITGSISGNAGTVGGLSVHSGTNNEANKIVRTDGNGYILAGWINTPSGDSGAASRIDHIYCSTDSYIRFLSLTNFKMQMGLSYKSNYQRYVDYTSDSNYWVGSMGHSGYGANEVFHGGSGFFDVWSGTNYPSGTSHIHGFNALHYTTNSLGSTGGNAYGWQMASQYNQTGRFWVRSCSAGTFSSWYESAQYGLNNGGTLYADAYYDSNTSYYVDPSSSSYLNVVGAAGRFYTGYDSGQTSSFSCSNWFRSNGSTGWYNASYDGGIYMEDSTWVRVYSSKAFYVANQIAATGNITAYYSDERLKTKTGIIENATNKLLSLDAFYYVNNEIAKENGYTSEATQVGLSAQQVQKVLPEVVSLAPFDMETEEFTGVIKSKSGENYLTVDYAKIVPLIVQAFKEQALEVAELKQQLAALLNKQ